MKIKQMILLLYSYHQCSGRAYIDDDDGGDGNGDGTYYDLMGKEKVKQIPDFPDEKAEYAVKEVSIKDLVDHDKKEYAWRDRYDLTSTTLTAMLDVNDTQALETLNYTQSYRRFWSTIWQASSGALMAFLTNYEVRYEAGNEWDLNTQVCYLLGVTYKNAKTDILDYESLRYLYTNIKEYEIGYVIEEIIIHYQIAIELFHIMLQKYGEHKDQNYASTSYMLYMYTNILHQCKVIQHLCNMLHELRTKYQHDKKETIFDDYHLIKPKPAKVDPGYDKALAVQEERNENERLMKERQRQKDMEKIIGNIGKMQKAKGHGKKLFEFGSTKKRIKGPLDLHYGWSIESWT